MSNEVLKYIILITLGLFAVVVAAYIMMTKTINNKQKKHIRELKQGTKSNKYSADVIYQKLYLIYIKIPPIKRYLTKLRRRLEIINIEDEYQTRRNASSILTKALLIIVPLTFIIIAVAKNNIILLLILIIFEILMIETITEGFVDKIDTKLLKQQIDFFTDIRHAYHETNMVEEAIYDVSQSGETEIYRQGEKIYELLIADDPEAELEKYYDIAPNSYLKEFAGISYLTREFGDRTTSDGASLYLKNLNNITQEIQIEILKRDKLDYIFQSLSVIAVVPIIALEPLKSWAVSNFSFTQSFYNGKLGMIAQILIMIITIVCFLMIRKVKDTSSSNVNMKNSENPWQEKIYKIPVCKQFVNLFVPRKGTKDYKKITELLKSVASKQKMEWLYINRIVTTIIVFIVSLVLMQRLHKISIDYVYNEPTTDYNLISLSDTENQKAMEVTRRDNIFLKKFKGKLNTTELQIENALRLSEYYEDATDEEIQNDAERIYNKLKIINAEYLKWYEVVIAIVFAVAGYNAPILMLKFQKQLRQLDMEDEVMQFQTIILMLMKIERVNVEIILEWLERYARIFKEPITKCVNNYESGALEALEELKDDISFPKFTAIVESMQSAVENIPIKEAFDELDTEREYYQEKRKESNERLISRKGMIGKVLGFAPMVCLFVGYLIVPLVVIGMLSMVESFNSMSTMM